MAVDFVAETTVTATAAGTNPIPWPDAGPNSNKEATLYITTANGPVRAIKDSGDTTGILVPNNKTNYAVDTWKLTSNEKPEFLYASSDTDCDVTIVIHG